MKKVLLFLLICLSFNVFAQSSLEEVVYLKNGSIIRGTIIEQIPNVKIKIQTSEGNVFVYKYDEIEKITKEPQYLVSPNATNNNTVSDEIKSHKAKGIALTVTGGTIFSIDSYNDFGYWSWRRGRIHFRDNTNCCFNSNDYTRPNSLK
ncbi:MAG: hypothetical protein IPH74_16095 [Bacteroidetes bacterium]|nr:hypothetical protein [Bacteroidota bacterium]